jgi:hypothetical protein
MALTSRRRSAVKESIDDILRRISALPSSTEVLGLRALAEGYLKEAGTWSSSQPAAEQKERLMKRLLKLHSEVARLERGAPFR